MEAIHKPRLSLDIPVALPQDIHKYCHRIMHNDPLKRWYNIRKVARNIKRAKARDDAWIELIKYVHNTYHIPHDATEITFNYFAASQHCTAFHVIFTKET